MARQPWKVNGSYPTKPCQQCGIAVEVTERARWDRTKFCSKDCFYAGRELKNLFEPGHPDLVPASSRGHSQETKNKISEIQRQNRKIGAEHPNWRGGLRNERRKAMSRWEYREWRRQVFERDGYACVKCCKGGYLHADHVQTWSEAPHLRYDVDNGRTLCVPCHYEVTFGKKDMEKAFRWGIPATRIGDQN